MAILFGLSAIAPCAEAQFASGVSLVEVYATVLDGKGAPVRGLPADAFTVEEDGVPQPLQAFSSGELPLALAIAVDRSFSVPAARLGEVTRSVQRLLGELRPEDRTMLLAVGSEVEAVTPLSVDHRVAFFAVGALTPWGTTPLYDAVVAAIDRIQQASGRRALILISDGGDTYSGATAAEAIAYARSRDVLVYPVALRPAPPPVFAEIASVTGGRSFATRDERDLTTALSTIAGELRAQYLLGYPPPPTPVAGTWRDITVRVNRPGMRVRARDGYASTATAAAPAR